MVFVIIATTVIYAKFQKCVSRLELSLPLLSNSAFDRNDSEFSASCFFLQQEDVGFHSILTRFAGSF